MILCQILRCRFGIFHRAAGFYAVEFLNFRIQIGHILPDNDLILTVLDDDVEHAGHTFYPIGVKFGGIPQYQPQTSHAMRGTDDIPFAAGFFHNALRHDLIILFCHYFSISLPQSFPLERISFEYQ